MYVNGSSSSSNSGGGDAPMPSPSCRLLPAVTLGIAAVAVLFQSGYGGLTVTSFFLKLFIYVSFVLFCFLLGSLGSIVKKSPPKIIPFKPSKRQSHKLQDVFNKLMVSKYTNIKSLFFKLLFYSPIHSVSIFNGS